MEDSYIICMPVIGKNVVSMVSSLLLCAGARAITPDSGNPYQGIIDRNVFALKPMPINKIDEGVKKPDPPKITLTGITDILGKKQALMNVAMPAKPPEPAKQQSFIIASGQRDGDLEVLDIDVKVGSVKLNNFGTEMLLTMEKDGAKLPASVAAAMPIPGVAPNGAGYVPPANGYTPAGANPGLKPIPTRQLRVPGNADNGMGTPNPTTGFNANPGFNATPANGVNVAQPGFAYAQPVQQPVQQPQQSMSPDEQAINMLIQHKQNETQGIAMPPLPPPLAEVYDGPKTPE